MSGGGEKRGSAGRKGGRSVECRSSRLFVPAQLIQRDQVGRERDPGGTIRESFGYQLACSSRSTATIVRRIVHRFRRGQFLNIE